MAISRAAAVPLPSVRAHARRQRLLFFYEWEYLMCVPSLSALDYTPGKLRGSQTPPRLQIAALVGADASSDEAPHVFSQGLPSAGRSEAQLPYAVRCARQNHLIERSSTRPNLNTLPAPEDLHLRLGILQYYNFVGEKITGEVMLGHCDSVRISVVLETARGWQGAPFQTSTRPSFPL